jgi:hypothetical protein
MRHVPTTYSWLDVHIKCVLLGLMFNAVDEEGRSCRVVAGIPRVEQDQRDWYEFGWEYLPHLRLLRSHE